MLKKFLLWLSTCVISIAFGLLFVVIFVNSTEVNCRLQSDESYTCQIRTLLLGKVQLRDRHVEHVVDIKMERDSCDDGCSYRAEFVTAEGKQVPLSEVYTDQAPVLEQVNTLGSQMNRQEDRIVYKSDPPWWTLILIGGLTLMLLLLSPLVFLQRG
jgi:hypothetical protein